jgi:uncharacterized protein YdhG (YjbR/CyaY superfamily)
MPTKTTAKDKAAPAFSAAERAAMRERAKELKAGEEKAALERDLHEKIAAMPDADRVIAERVHAIVMAAAPHLTPKTWYGMPAYANGDGKLVCWFKPADKFKMRYATLGFEDAATLDEGSMWATSWALTKITDADAKRIADLVKQAAR